jgi:hypothetical protein
LNSSAKAPKLVRQWREPNGVLRWVKKPGEQRGNADVGASERITQQKALFDSN